MRQRSEATVTAAANQSSPIEYHLSPIQSHIFTPVKSYIPNTITLLNLFCGIAALINILDGQFIAAFWFLFAAGLFDFADGLVARMLNVSSEHGKELDSLADICKCLMVRNLNMVLLGQECFVNFVIPFNLQLP